METSYVNNGVSINWNILQLLVQGSSVLTNEVRSARYMVKKNKQGAEKYAEHELICARKKRLVHVYS